MAADAAVASEPEPTVDWRPGAVERAAVGAAGSPQPAAEAGGSTAVDNERYGPIAEAPEAVWYVRPPTGGQFGPASGAVMRRWIEEGRVSADTLVWREGWPDWRQAGSEFPWLASDGDPAPQPAASPSPQAAGIALQPAAQSSQPGAAPRKNSSLGVGVVVFLGVLAVVLVVILIVIVASRSSQEAESQPATSAIVVPQDGGRLAVCRFPSSPAAAAPPICPAGGHWAADPAAS